MAKAFKSFKSHPQSIAASRFSFDNMHYVIFGVLTAVLCSVFCVEIPENTCPYFSYMNSEYSYIYGRLILPNDGTGQYVLHVIAWIRGVYQSLPNLDVRLITTGDELYAGRNIEYWIYFPFWDPIPKITMVTLNENTYCSGSSFNMEYGTTTMWAQYVYTLGNRWSTNQYSPYFQYPTEERMPLQNPSEIPLSPQTHLQYCTSLKPSSNGVRQPDYNIDSEGKPDTSNSDNIAPYTSKIPVSSQGSFEIPDSSENSVEKSVPLKSPSYHPHLYTSKIPTLSQYSFELTDSSEDPPEDSPEEVVSTQYPLNESPLLISKHVAPNQNSRQKQMQDDDNNTTSFLRYCGTPNEDDTTFRMFNGKPSVEGQYSWLAALILFDGSSKGSYKCVANLISDKHLVTAAHCVSHFSKENLLLQFYSSDKTDHQALFEYYRSVIDVKISPFYITEPFGDVALLTINQSVVSLGATIKPICLWSGGKELDYTGTVAGWGLDEDGLFGVGTPKVIDISMVSSSKCIETYGLESDYRLFSDYCFCTAHDLAMPCKGDSGAGFMVKNDGRYFLRGIVSVGYRFCGRSSYTIFVDIVPHINWIMRLLE